MFVPWYDDSVRLTGRWSHLENKSQKEHPYAATATTAPGSHFEMAFYGSQIVLHFDLGYMGQPAPHLWISLDNEVQIEAPIDRFLRVNAQKDGYHIVRVIYKSGTEVLPRWYNQQMGIVTFLGAAVEAPAELPEDTRPIIEFIGDSITEGVLVDADYSDKSYNLIQQFNRTYQDDSFGTYAAMTAKELNLRPMFHAYGATGLTRSGNGGVPRAGLSYPYVFENELYTGEEPDVIVINHGANDRDQVVEAYLSRYEEFLDLVRQLHPKAVVIGLGAFCGAYDSELRDFIQRYNQKNHTKVYFISSNGWVPYEPLHPLRSGHKVIASHLVPLMKEILIQEGILA